MSRGGPVFSADTRGWGFGEWAHEAAIMRGVQKDRERRASEERVALLGGLANAFARYEELKRLEEGEIDG